MNKKALRNFAVYARKDLLQKVTAQAYKMGISKEKFTKATIESSDYFVMGGWKLTRDEQKKRDTLLKRMEAFGYDHVIEEVAYTWFNRFTALRYMEVNDYLPTRVRVLSSVDEDGVEPEMIKEALYLDLDIDKDYVYDLKMNNNSDVLFKYLIIKHCNDLNQYMPFMFETINDYTEILFPEGLLVGESFLHDMINTDIIPESDWQKIEIIGWLYQYYIAEEKERIYKAKKKYKTEEIPYATQLFTPNWIVRYMVQNSLGRYWLESHPEHASLAENWEYYITSQLNTDEAAKKLSPHINKKIAIEQLTCFDPAMGSGHILVYIFDVLFEIYSEAGYLAREIPRLIIEKNLYGLDIDERAYQLACFSIVMKALEYNRHFLRSIKRDGLKLNLACIQETNELSDEDIAYIANEDRGQTFDQVKQFIEQFHDAKTVGSLINITKFDKDLLHHRLHKMIVTPATNLFEEKRREKLIDLLSKLIKQAEIMAQTYDLFISNPPYAGRRYLNQVATKFLNKHYPHTKADLFSAFIEYSFSATKKNGQIAFMTPFVWMFITTYEKLRQEIIHNRNISSLIQLEYSGFDGATVPICTFTLRNYQVDISGEYIRLAHFSGSDNQPIKTLEAINDPHVSYRYTTNQSDYKKISGYPIAYWASDKIIQAFNRGTLFKDIGNPRVGMQTANNKKYLRFWYEVNFKELKNGNKLWIKYLKGGPYRRWYGNLDYVLRYNGDPSYILKQKNATMLPEETLEQVKCTWTDLTSDKFSARYAPKDSFHDISGHCFYPAIEDQYWLLGFTNSHVFQKIIRMINSTFHYQVGDVGKIPVIENDVVKQEVTRLTKEAIAIAKEDWDSFEISWDYKRHPLLTHKGKAKTLEDAFGNWKMFTHRQFSRLKTIEETINRIFINLYDLQDEMNSAVLEDEVTVRKADLERDIKSFISYAIGCILGRYSLDDTGVAYAGGDIKAMSDQSLPIEQDNILPITYEPLFSNDIVQRFLTFLSQTFGEAMVEVNLDFIAKVLKKRKTETARETIRRYLMTDFFKDHVQIYRKRPIYWLFTSGKEKAFNCLIYMHRYDQTTLSKIRVDYLLPYLSMLERKQRDLLQIIEENVSRKEVMTAKNSLKMIEKQIKEIQDYDYALQEMAHQLINIELADGVKVNHAKFSGVVAPIR